MGKGTTGGRILFHTFKNTGSTPLTFGESAQSNEMCIFVGAFYPAPAGLVTINCQ